MTYLVANWKSHFGNTQSLLWLKKMEKLITITSSNLKIIICLPFTDLSEFNRHLDLSKTPFLVGAQTVSPHPAGRHTGEVTAQMLSELVTHCLVGHSERRSSFKETSQDVAKQAVRLLEQNITPIICMDRSYINEQIKELFAVGVPLARCILAYEPAASIGSGQPESPNTAAKVITEISLLTSRNTPVLYGGSVSPANVLSFTSKPGISGVLVGTNSLKPSVFNQLIIKLSRSNEA